jgi:hypothetical protein
MQREGSLDTDAEGILAHGEGLTDARSLALDDDPLEDLHAAALALDHLEVHAHGVPRLEVGNVVAQLLALEDVDRSAHRKRPRGPTEC